MISELLKAHWHILVAEVLPYSLQEVVVLCFGLVAKVPRFVQIYDLVEVSKLVTLASQLGHRLRLLCHGFEQSIKTIYILNQVFSLV